MEKKKKEEVIEQITEQPKVDDTVEKIKVKRKPTMKKSIQDDKPIKVDLSKPVKTDEDTVKEVQEPTTTTSDVTVEQPKDSESSEKVVEEVRSSGENENVVQNEETPVLEEITETEQSVKTEQPEKILPEDVDKLIKFMNETGGDINDYIKLNQNYDELDNLSLLEQYYTQTKPHLNKEEISFLMEDQFSYDESYDDEKEIKRKKLALKEQVASAKSHLDGQKSKYYEDIKAGSKLTQEQQKAIDFFNRYNKESEVTQKAAKKNTEIFTQKTNQVFNDKFKGFEYSVGDKKYRFNVNNAEEVKSTQSDINNFTKKFLDKNSTLSDAKGYHKSLFTAMNADAIANHFYEQGKTDAMKNSVAKAKNVDMNPRQSHGEIETGGLKFKVLGDNSSDFKFKIKQK